MRRIVKSGITKEDIETLSSLVSSSAIPTNFIQQVAGVVKEDWTTRCNDPISVSTLMSFATFVSCGYLPIDFIKNEDTGIMSRIIKSGITDDDITS